MNVASVDHVETIIEEGCQVILQTLKTKLYGKIGFLEN